MQLMPLCRQLLRNGRATLEAEGPEAVRVGAAWAEVASALTLAAVREGLHWVV